MQIATITASPSRPDPGMPNAARIGSMVIALVLALFLPLASLAEGIGIRTATLEPSEEGWQLDADFDIQFSPRLEEAVTRGVPLYFVVEFELSKPRWYWFDEKPVRQTQTYKISYTPLLRQYRLSSGNAYQNFTRFDEVKRVLARVRGWHVADKGALSKEMIYQANLRMRLDTAQLPKPFQLNAVASRDWTLGSEWHRWTISP
jgi:ribosomal protein L29